MKTFLSLLIVCFFILGSKAQKVADKDVPSSVKDAFTKKYPDAVKPVWEKTSDNFMAKFKADGLTSNVLYTYDGVWMESYTYVNEKEVPTGVTTYLKNNFTKENKYIIKDIQLKEKREGKFYVVNVREQNVKGNIEVTFKTDGTLVSAIDQEGAPFKDKKEEEKTVVTEQSKEEVLGYKRLNQKDLPFPIQFYMAKFYPNNAVTIKDAFLMKNEAEEQVYFLDIKKGDAKTSTGIYFDKNAVHIAEKDAKPTEEDLKFWQNAPKTADEMKDREKLEKELAKQKEKEEAEAAEKAKYKVTDNSTPDDMLISGSANDKVKAVVTKKFKGIGDISWKNHNNNVVAEFLFGKANDTTRTEYTPEAVLVKTQTILAFTALPAPVQKYVNTNQKKQKVLSCNHWVTAKKEDYYQIKTVIQIDKYTTEINEVKLDKLGKVFVSKEEQKATKGNKGARKTDTKGKADPKAKTDSKAKSGAQQKGNTKKK